MDRNPVLILVRLLPSVMGTRPLPTTRSRRLRRLCLLGAFGAAGLCHAPCSAAPGQASADAILLRPLSFFKVDDLNFGTIVPGNSAGTVTVHPDSSRTSTGGVTPVGNTHQPARFAGLGSYNRQVMISISSNSIQLTGPGAPMTVSQFEIGSTPTAILSTAPLRFRISNFSGQFNFPVGGTLNVNAHQAPGTYSGNFTITLIYL